ncbi:MAG TPA: hypothetical protein VM574_09795 [Terrimicrobiaceae bacterium]|nr:hypothetical protein [Terrimicrobiaceae bacterium]
MLCRGRLTWSDSRVSENPSPGTEHIKQTARALWAADQDVLIVGGPRMAIVFEQP